jgi:hypothetical protein
MVARSRGRIGEREHPELGAHLALDEQWDVVPHPGAAKPGQAALHRRSELGLGEAVAGAVPEARDDGTHLTLAECRRTRPIHHRNLRPVVESTTAYPDPGSARTLRHRDVGHAPGAPRARVATRGYADDPLTDDLAVE